MIERLFISLLLTLILETVYALGWKVHGKDLKLIWLMNVLTNPLVVIWNNLTVSSGIMISTVLPELAAVAVEGFLLKRYGRDISYPLLLSICINLFSYFSGMLFNYLFWR